MPADRVAVLSSLPAFLVRDVRAAAEFYRDAFGFRVCWVLGDGPGEFSIVDLGAGHGIHLKRSSGHSGRSNRRLDANAIDAYLRLADVDGVHARAARAGAHVVSAPADRASGMREFVALDRDGHALCFAQDITAAAGTLVPRTSPEFLVPDVAGTLRFYRDALGFERADAWGDPPAYGIAARGGAIVHFARTDDTAAIRSNYDELQLWDVYVEVRGVDALARELLGRGVHVLREPETQSYGMREMDVQDRNGYVICFGESTDS